MGSIASGCAGDNQGKYSICSTALWVRLQHRCRECCPQECLQSFFHVPRAFGENTYIPDISELVQEKHQFEQYLNNFNENNFDNNSKGIPQLITNSNFELRLPTDNKTNYINKNIENNKEKGGNKIDMSLENKDDNYFEEYDEE